MNILAFEAPKKEIVFDDGGIVRVRRSEKLHVALAKFFLHHGPVSLPKFCTLNGEAVKLLSTDYDSYVFKRFENVIDGVAAMETE